MNEYSNDYKMKQLMSKWVKTSQLLGDVKYETSMQQYEISITLWWRKLV